MTVKQTWIAATRASKLALTQARWAADQIEMACGVKVELMQVSSTGDQIQDRPLDSFGGVGIFVKELEQVLLRGDADFAIHSLKDVPTRQPEGLVIPAVLPREDPRDVLISPEGLGLMDLPQGARVGTGSPRRILQLRALRPDLQFLGLRGNIDTRINKMRAGEADALILAAAGMKRLGLLSSTPHCFLEIHECLPAPGQGALALECKSDSPISEILAAMGCKITLACVQAERELLNRVEGGCSVPLGSLAEISGEEIHLRVVAGDLKTQKLLQMEKTGAKGQAVSLGKELADAMLEYCSTQGICLK